MNLQSILTRKDEDKDFKDYLAVLKKTWLTHHLSPEKFLKDVLESLILS